MSLHLLLVPLTLSQGVRLSGPYGLSWDVLLCELGLDRVSLKSSLFSQPLMVAPLYAIGVQLMCLLPTLAPKHHREGRYYSCDVGCAVPGNCLAKSRLFRKRQVTAEWARRCRIHSTNTCLTVTTHLACCGHPGESTHLFFILILAGGIVSVLIFQQRKLRSEG